jgi:polyisoprenoid-binding protein YceI
MRKAACLLGILLAVSFSGEGQEKYLSNDGFISFYSHTPLEDIKAEHREVSGVIDAASGEVAVIVKMTGFEFRKKLMQEHFNENYVESHKYPKSTFSGRITNNTEIDYTSQGSYEVLIEGTLTIHGVTNEISARGTLEVLDKGIKARTSFIVRPEDYDIKIPRVVRNNIAKEVEVTFELHGLPI